jgi:predicted nucleic acid-binding protein
MTFLLDTNILARNVQIGHPQHQPAVDAVTLLRSQGHTLCIVPQNLYEFWVICTRPSSANGLGKTVSEVATEFTNLKALFTLLEDTPAILPAWEQLVTAHSVLGKNAHDARLVAAMVVHGVTHLLTFNDADFNRFSGITVLTPAAVLAPPTVAPPVHPAPPPPPPSP